MIILDDNHSDKKMINKDFFQDLFSEVWNKHSAEVKASLLLVKDGDEVDMMTQEREKSLNIKLEGRQYFYLNKVREAMKRIADGTFGECMDCGEKISPNRLLARPTATVCIKCKDEMEKDENCIEYEHRSHTLGKSLKNNNMNNVKFGESKNEDISRVIKSVSLS